MTVHRKSWAPRARALIVLALGAAAAIGCAGADSIDGGESDDLEAIGQLEEPLRREADLDELAAETEINPPDAAEARQLALAKRIDQWPTQVSPTGSGSTVVALTVRECTWLGGTVVFWASCGTTLMKCVGANGREMCIDKIALTSD